jgi:NDP-sugar pyrophosphorylase family protein
MSSLNARLFSNSFYLALIQAANLGLPLLTFPYQIPYGVINGEGNKITSMIEKPVHRFFVNAGIYVLSPQVINSVAKNEKIDMPSLLEKHMNERQNVLMFPIHEYWLDIGRMDDFNRAQTDIYNLGLD